MTGKIGGSRRSAWLHPGDELTGRIIVILKKFLQNSSEKMARGIIHSTSWRQGDVEVLSFIAAKAVPGSQIRVGRPVAIAVLLTILLERFIDTIRCFTLP